MLFRLLPVRPIKYGVYIPNSNILQEQNSSLVFNLGTVHLFIHSVVLLEKCFHTKVQSYHYLQFTNKICYMQLVAFANVVL